MSNKDETGEPGAYWPVSFEDVEEDHLNEMLKLTPVQRLELAEELLGFAVLAEVVDRQDRDS